MQLEKTLAVAQYATWWVQKLTLLLIFLASQFREAGRIEMESEIIFSMDQF
jgi:hypothetical protein